MFLTEIRTYCTFILIIINYVSQLYVSCTFTELFFVT